MYTGKHEAPQPISEALELHYKEEIKMRDNRLSELEKELDEAKHQIERLEFRAAMQKTHVEELERALIKMTIDAASK